MRSLLARAMTSAALCLWVGCASAPPETLERTDVPWPELFPELVQADPEGELPFVPKPRSQELEQRLIAAQNAFGNERTDEFERIRDELAEDRFAAYHLTRYLMWWREAKEQLVRNERRSDPLLFESVQETPWTRAEDQVVLLGGAAAPALVLDIGRLTDARRRRLRMDLLGRIGGPAIPALETAFQAEDWQTRRDVVRTLGRMRGPNAGTQSTPLLERATRDAHWGVRAAAYEALAAIEGGGARFRQALQTEEDPFVRRTLILSLASYREEPQNARILLQFLEDAVDAEDVDATKTAQQALERYSGRLDKAGLLAWRAYIAELEGRSDR